MTYTASDLLKGRRISKGISLPTAMIAAIKTLSSKEKSSVSGFVQQAVIEYITKENGENDTPHPIQ